MKFLDVMELQNFAQICTIFKHNAMNIEQMPLIVDLNLKVADLVK